MSDTMERVGLRFMDLKDQVQDTLMYGLGDGYWHERSQDLTAQFKDRLSEKGFDASTEVHWSLASCQGDGVSFTVERFEATDLTDPAWVQNVLSILGSNKESGTVAGVNVSWPAPILRLDIKVDQSSSHYCHAYTMRYFIEAHFVLRDPNEAPGWCNHESGAAGDEAYDPVSGMETWTCECGAAIGHIEDLDDNHPVAKAVAQYFIAVSHEFEKIGYAELEDHYPARFWFRGKRFDEGGEVIFEYDDPDDDPDDDA